MPEIGSRDDKELIVFVVLLFMLNIFCDVNHVVIDKHCFTSDGFD